MQSCRVNLCAGLLSVLERYIKEQHLPVQVQRGFPIEQENLPTRYDVLFDYPDNFDFKGQLLNPANAKYLEEVYGKE